MFLKGLDFSESIDLFFRSGPADSTERREKQGESSFLIPLLLDEESRLLVSSAVTFYMFSGIT